MDKSPVRVFEDVDDGEKIEGFTKRRVGINPKLLQDFLREVADRFGIDSLHAILIMGAAIGSASGIKGFIEDATSEQRADWVNEIAQLMSEAAARKVSEINLLRRKDVKEV